tara:strand:+ start:117 stop:617 length:501 start_codon:yes stop_codon:yes gene_type:complete
MIEFITQKLPIIIETYPLYPSLNFQILKEIKDVPGDMSYKTNVKAQMSGWNTTTPSIERLNKWICDILVRDNSFLRAYSVSVDSCWVATYKKDEFANLHDHILYPYSFVYFVKSPRGSSPLVVGSREKRIKAEEGRVVIFSGSLTHRVPKNKCDGRIVVAGNIQAG